jgi:ArsR family transcriptional regulator
MDRQDKDIYSAQARIIKALAHPARLLMVNRLAKGPKCVCEIRDWVGSDMSTVSKHLSVLRNAGIVADEKRGMKVYYRLRCPCVNQFLRCAEKVMKTTADDHVRLAGKRGKKA